MVKKFLFGIIVSSLMFCGCISEKSKQFENCNSNIQLTTDFNQEHYIWENWSFSTNRVVR